jgi:ElaB/YqjD/DUF883 family membrane-anchored ribosome-binding protein
LTQVKRPTATTCQDATAMAKEATMTKCVKDTFGYLGTEPVALREQLEELSRVLQDLAKAEGAEAIKAASNAARRIAERAGAVAEELSGKADAVAAAAAKGRGQIENAIREQPLAAISLAAAAGFLLALLVRR